MKYDFLVLGADGMQGRIVVRDLLQSGFTVFCADLFKDRIEKLLHEKRQKAGFTFVDLRDIDMTINVIEKSGANVVINCAEGDWDLNVYKACIAARVHCIDLGSRIAMTKDQLAPAIHHKFINIRRVAITGCGSVPGIGNVMLRHAARKFDSLETVHAGFAWDSNMKEFVVPFSIESILEEFTLPAPYIENRKWLAVNPMDTIIKRYFRSIGSQQCFLADHSEQFTFYHYFKRKGLKNVRFYAGFPDHSIEVIRTLIKLGFQDPEPVKTKSGNGGIKPNAFLTQLLKRLIPSKKYREWENLWVEITGRKKREKKTILMECIVPTLKGWEDAGCNIDTGMPASIIAQMIKRGVIAESGSFAPEAVVPEREFFQKLAARKMAVYEDGMRIN